MKTIARIQNGRYIGGTEATAVQKERFAEMLQLQAAPKGMTDDTFCAGMGTLSKQFEGEEHMLDVIVKKAKKKGYTPNYNDVYCPALADSQGDPKAFLPHNARGHIKAVAAERGWNVDGAVTCRNYSPPVSDPLEGKTRISDLVKE